MPSLVTIILGYQCNSNCIMCVLPDFGSPFFSAEEVKEFIREIDLKTGDCIELSGGEPTLHRDFFDLCRFAVENSDAEIWLVSNGRRFKDRGFAKNFVKTGCKGVVIPLHSHSHLVHDEITEMKGSFYETLMGLENLQDLGAPLIIRFIAMRQNYAHAIHFMGLISERFPKQRVLFSGLCYMGLAGQRVEKVGVPFSEVKKHIEPALDLAAEEGVPAGLCLMPLCVFSPHYWKYFDSAIARGDIAANYWATLGLAKEENEFGYPPLCETCELKRQCKWEWDIYAKHYGLSELHPKTK